MKKIILSRKGFDSSTGGVPSPIMTDGSLVSIPIPDPYSPVKYKDLNWNYQKTSLSELVNVLTSNKIKPTYGAHLDPDLNFEMVKNRPTGWKPSFGQVGAAQTHLKNQGVCPGCVFLFFGLFQELDWREVWYRNEPPMHLIWGWMEVGEIIDLNERSMNVPDWVKNHPHYFHKEDPGTLYVGSAAKVFNKLAETTPLTNPEDTPSCWRLPRWLVPSEERPKTLTYNNDLQRWGIGGPGYALLKSSSRGQEFVIDCDVCPESREWAKIIMAGQGQTLFN